MPVLARFAFDRDRPDESPDTAVRNPALPEGSAIERLLEVTEDASAIFLVRFSDASRLALRPAHIVQEALEQVLLEPCAVTLIAFTPGTLAAVVTPRSARPFDPLHIHSLVEMLRRSLAAFQGLSGDVPEAGGTFEILPLACVSSITVLRENLAALNELLETLINRRLRVQFQPIIHLPGGRIHGYEALIRAPQGGVLRRLGTLFQVADKARLVSWLDIACMEQCFAGAAQEGVHDYLFVNMDAEGLAQLHFADRSPADRAAEFMISPSRVVLEITERQAVEDYPRLTQYIEGLREQGFKIAIDDAGAGYSSLHTIAELRPEFVKIDRSLMRCIQDNGPRRALLVALARFAEQVGAAVIAEGIETRDELATVIEAGVSYAQGYLLGKPNDGFRGLRRAMREQIVEDIAHYRRRKSGCSYAIAKMARCGITMPSETPVEEIARKFEKMPDLESIVLVNEERIEGLMMRDRFYQALATDGKAIRLPALRLMDRQPLIVEAETPVEEVAQRVAHRCGASFHHDILVADGRFYVGVVPVRALMEAVTTLLQGQRVNGSMSS